jgi:hypothetical protein
MDEDLSWSVFPRFLTMFTLVDLLAIWTVRDTIQRVTRVGSVFIVNIVVFVTLTTNTIPDVWRDY